MAVNVIAQSLWRKASPLYARADVLVGPVVVQGPVNRNGDATACPGWVAQFLAESHVSVMAHAPE
jgi:hypothetical protein